MGPPVSVITDYLVELDLSSLKEVQRKGLDEDLQLEELKKVVRDMARHKAQGPGGWLVEYYQAYEDLLLPRLLETLHRSKRLGALPPLRPLWAAVIEELREITALRDLLTVPVRRVGETCCSRAEFPLEAESQAKPSGSNPHPDPRSKHACGSRGEPRSLPATGAL
ncbi:hypothetical protein NDU88_010063 [Pleurodeles waltl]|uniref:Uncharacterized protein n=1 Tax=Pleurodeles waltl TaxID=8319 RepID=A0AAV7PUN4_PLEWA|nr:hypothetical protein NDU88_010063 [Pleurodeles waltl]